jgi:hypothetical protein
MPGSRAALPALTQGPERASVNVARSACLLPQDYLSALRGGPYSVHVGPGSAVGRGYAYPRDSIRWCDLSGTSSSP